MTMDGIIGAGEVLVGTILGYGTAASDGVAYMVVGVGTIHGDLTVGTTGVMAVGAVASDGVTPVVGA